MPSTSDIDERYEELAALVRATRPKPSAELREQVRALGASPVEVEQAPGRRFAFPFRGAAIVFASMLLVGAVAVIGVGLRDGGDKQVEPAAVTRQLTPLAQRDQASQSDSPSVFESLDGAEPAPLTRSATAGGTVLAPSGTRLQDYRVTLRVRVGDLDELSATTRRAMRIARSLGGFIVTARYERPAGGEGDSLLVVRVPVTKVQQAISSYSELGTIVAQTIQISDLQQQVNRQTEGIQALRRTIAQLEESLRDPTLSDEARGRLEARLTSAQASLARATESRDATVRQGRLASVSLTLTTRAAAQPKPDEPGYVPRTLEDAWSVLSKVVAWTLYGLIVASPFLLLALAAVPLERQRRRRAEERLLERA